jgi:Zn-dependent protease
VRDSFPIGRVFNIEIRVHYLFPLILAFLVATAESPLMALFLVLMLFGVVFLHELGHSLAAQAFGIQVLDITFWPLGGMARMADLPENPRIEGLVAIAGPAVNGVLFTAGLMVHVLLGLPLLGNSIPGYFVVINLMMGLFNLIPAFPMDGGRILRAWLARKRDWLDATEIAVQIGRAFALGMIIFGYWLTGGWVMPFIGAWVWWMGARELWHVRMKHKARAAYESTLWPDNESGRSLTLKDLGKIEDYRGQLKDYKPRD